MSKSITSFFKRKADDAAEDGAAKAPRPDGPDAEATPEAAEGALSSEQQQRMDASKVAVSIAPLDLSVTVQALRKRALATGVPETGLLGRTWVNALSKEFEKPYYKQLTTFLAAEHAAGQIIHPSPDNVFSWGSACALDKVRVVVIGQDPYHGPNQAHGLCFSVQKGVPVPPSLVNIYKELETDIPGFKRPKHGCLTSWAEQGVLLLNAVLTVRQGQANSHKDKGWEKFTDAVIEAVNHSKQHVVFIEWGLYAQKKGAKVDKSKHCVLSGAHPSPLSATKFFGCKHFSKTNEYLKSKGYAPINWSSVMDDPA